MERGKWCFACDQWVGNYLSANKNKDAKESKEAVVDYWKQHEATMAHIEKRKITGDYLDVKWDGHTIVASVSEGQKNLEFRQMCLAMRKYGYTTKLYPLDDTYVVSYRDQKSAEVALGAHKVFNGTRINTRPLFLNVPKANKPFNLKELRLSTSDLWEQQAKEMAVALKVALTPEDQLLHKQKTDKLCADVVKVLQPAFCNVECLIFGSRATGLAGIDSDVDIHVKLDLTGSEFESSLMNKEDHENLLRTCVKMFRRKPVAFTNIFAVHTARVPVMHFLHLPTRLECDLTFKNMLAVYNSQFLKFIVSQDERIFYLFLIIKHWRKAHSLTMSNYSFTMLAIYYLQTLPQPMLPPILQLKGNAESMVVDQGWVCSFKDTPLKNENTSPLKELVIGFFKFLTLLDFGVDVFCPLLATSVEKWKFLQPETIPDPMQCLAEAKENESLQVKKPACVQDPFELNHNVTKALGQKHVTDLVNLCSKVVDYCDKNSNLSLKDLLTFTPSKKDLKQQGLTTTFRILLHNYFPSYDLLQSASIQELWFPNVLEVVYNIFTEVLTCQEVVDEAKVSGGQSDSDAPPTKMQKMPSVASNHLASWVFTTPFVLLNGRKKQQLAVKGCYFTREVLATKMMIKKFYRSPELIDKSFHLNFKVEVTSHEKPASISLNLINVKTPLDTFKALCKCVSQDLQAMVDKTLMTPYKEELQKLKSLDTLEEQLEVFLMDDVKNMALKDGEPVATGTVSDPEQSNNINSKSDETPEPSSSNPFLEAIEKLA